jgi:hypothetical protein
MAIQAEDSLDGRERLGWIPRGAMDGIPRDVYGTSQSEVLSSTSFRGRQRSQGSRTNNSFDGIWSSLDARSSKRIGGAIVVCIGWVRRQ